MMTFTEADGLKAQYGPGKRRVTPARRKLAAEDRMPPQTEWDFQAQVMDMARRLGWTLQYHTWSSRHSAAGFPDLVLLHPKQKRVLYVECKALDRYGIPKRLTPAQAEWIETLRACGQDVRVWTPLDWDEIERALGRMTK